MWNQRSESCESCTWRLALASPLLLLALVSLPAGESNAAVVRDALCFCKAAAPGTENVLAQPKGVKSSCKAIDYKCMRSSVPSLLAA